MEDISDLPAPSKLDISDLPAPKSTTQSALGTIAKGMQNYMAGPQAFTRGLVGETAKTAGGLADIVSEPTGKKLTEFGQEQIQKGKAVSPVSTGLGQLGSYVAPITGVETGLTKLGVPVAKSVLGKMGRAGLTGATIGAATTPGTAGERAETGVKQALEFAVFQGAFSTLAKGKEVVEKLFGGDARKAAETLRETAKRLTGEQAKIANTLAEEYKLKAEQGERIKGKTEERITKAYTKLPGVTTTTEAGIAKPIPTSKENIGQNIKSYADQISKRLRDVRNANAERIKGNAFDEAARKENQGQFAENTEIFKTTMARLDKLIKDTTLPAIKNPLIQIRQALDPKFVDESGIVVGKPAKFESLEQIRRFLRDRSFGLPAEGFDAINQQMAGKLGDDVEAIMREFSPNIKNFLEQYKKDSEPLRVFQTKIGKALTAEQVPGAKGYAVTAAEDIPNKVFKNREGYQALIEAVGGDVKFAENEAKKHFVNELEKIGSDPTKIENFIRENRSMINTTNAKEMIDKYAKLVRESVKRGENAELVSKNLLKAAEKQIALKDTFDTLESNINIAQTPEQVARQYENFATGLLKNKLISQQEYQAMLQNSNNVLKKVEGTEKARASAVQAAKYALYSLGVGSAGYAGYQLIKLFD